MVLAVLAVMWFIYRLVDVVELLLQKVTKRTQTAPRVDAGAEQDPTVEPPGQRVPAPEAAMQNPQQTPAKSEENTDDTRTAADSASFRA